MRNIVVSHVHPGIDLHPSGRAVRSISDVLVASRRLRPIECALSKRDNGLFRSRWPWVLEGPGRSAELPTEDIFDGFDGLDELFNDNVEVATVEEACSTSKVSREVRNACHSPVSIDEASSPALVALSKTGAALVGLPYDDAVRAMTTNQVGRPPLFRKQQHSGEPPQTATVDPSATANAEAVRGGRSTPPEQELGEFARVLTGTTQVSGCQPFASCYGGHQFGNWAGQLGDGRVATLGEVPAVSVRNTRVSRLWNGHLLEIQLKGIGKTPFSRGGDGKAALGACLREYLFSEALVGLGAAATVAVSVCTTGEAALIRDPDPKNSGVLRRSPGAVLCRVAPSFLRFGSFELPARRGEVAVVRALADYCRRHLRPYLLSLEEDLSTSDHNSVENILDHSRVGYSAESATGSDHENHANGTGCTESSKGSQREYLELLITFVKATARMVAEWQALGFCHGVLNTDNFTLLGLGLDFGPCSFMEKYAPSWSPNEGDSARRYTFQNQPDVAAWNCERLSEAFSSLVGQSGVAAANVAFSPAFDAAYTAHLQRKLGLEGMDLGNGWAAVLRNKYTPNEGPVALPPDGVFVLNLLRLMEDCGTDYTDTWRALSGVPALSVAGDGDNVPGLRLRSGEELVSSVGSNKMRAAGPDLDISEDGQRECGSLMSEDVEICDNECLQPMSAILADAKASRDQMRQWAQWIRQYMVRIDEMGIGRHHPEGEQEGRRERLEVMRTSNPAFILRAKALDQALNAAQDGDMSHLHRLEAQLAAPYDTDLGNQG